MTNWIKMAMDCQAAAELCHRRNRFRSSVSRSYFAAFSVITAILRKRGLMPRTGRESWAHLAMPSLLMEHLEQALHLPLANEINYRLRRLYTMRIDADYHSEREVDERTARDCVSYAREVLDTLETLL